MPSPSPRAAAYTPPAHPDFFVQAPISVIRARNLTPVEKTTYAVLRSYADSEGNAYLGQVRLAAEVGVSERTVRTVVQTLVAVGLITRRQRGQGRTNIYHLLPIPLRPARHPADRHPLPLKTSKPRRAKPAPVAAELDREERDPADQDQPPPPLAPQIIEAGGENTTQIEVDTVLITQATGMAPDEARTTAQLAASGGHDPGYIAELVAHVTTSPAVHNPAGCLRALVQRGTRRPARGAGGVPPRPQRPALHPEHYGPGGKYAHLFHREEAAPPSASPPPPPLRRGPSAFEIAADPALAGRGVGAWPRGQPSTGS